MRRSFVAGCAVLFAGATVSPAARAEVTPAEIERRLDDQAEQTKKIAPRAARIGLTDFAWPASAEEYKRLGKFILVLVVAVTQDERELPLKRVYIDAKGRIIPLQRLSSERRELPAAARAAPVIGRYREDGFYLAPAGAMASAGDLLVDFAVNRTGFRLYELPGTPPKFVVDDRNPNPAKGAKPDRRALKTVLEREYPGFPLPAALR